MPRVWLSALRNVIAVLLLGIILGWLNNQLLLGLLAGALSCLVWYLWQLYQLEHWLRRSDWSVIPNEGGVWGEIYLRFVRLRQRGRKRKRKLSRILKQFRKAVAALPDAIVALNEEGHVLWFNRIAARLLGLRAQDIGLPITLFLRHPQFVAFVNNSIREQQTDSTAVFPSPLDEQMQLQARLIVYGKKQRLLIIMDITQSQRFERARRDFVANASHELRTPVTVLSGYLETLLDSDDPCVTHWRQPLESMRQQSARMQHIIESLLLLSRLENAADPQSRQPVAVANLLEGIVEDAGILDDGSRHAIALELDESLLISGSRQELASAFSNLIFNAVRHTAAGTRITVRWFGDEHGIHFQVEDNGEGIAPQHLPRLSERFYRIDRGRRREQGADRSGTGLGLAIVKHVVQRHGGELKIESELGSGSIFTCTFPLARRVANDKGLVQAV